MGVGNTRGGVGKCCCWSSFSGEEGTERLFIYRLGELGVELGAVDDVDG